MELTQAFVRIMAIFTLVQPSVVEGGRKHHQARLGDTSNIRRLHEMLAIDTSDPREDIRTNRVLNMEGF
jgi:hypothetical protein